MENTVLYFLTNHQMSISRISTTLTLKSIVALYFPVRGNVLKLHVEMHLPDSIDELHYTFLYYKIRWRLLQNVTVMLLQIVTKVYYKMRQDCYYKMQHFIITKYGKLLQTISVNTTISNIKLLSAYNLNKR